MLHKPEGAPETDASDRDDDSPPPMRPDLQAKFDALPDSVRNSTTFSKRIGPEDNVRLRVDLAMLALRHNGFSLEEIVEASRSFTVGCGLNALGRQTPLLIAELWAGQDKIEAEREAARGERRAKIAKHLTITDEPWNPDTLPARPWLAPPYLMRGELTLVHGPGGSGKSQLAICWSIALALGKQYGRLIPMGRSRVLLPNFEDGDDEQRRRISAALRYFGATEADLTGWLFRVCLGPAGDATMFDLDEFGAVRTTECWEALEMACEDIRPDAIFPDPLVAINAVPEKDNQLMRRVMVILKGLVSAGADP